MVGPPLQGIRQYANAIWALHEKYTFLSPQQKRLKVAYIFPPVSMEISLIWSSSLTQTRKFPFSLCHRPRASGQSRAIPAANRIGDAGFSKRKWSWNEWFLVIKMHMCEQSALVSGKAKVTQFWTSDFSTWQEEHSSDWSVNGFMMVIYEIYVILQTKRILTEIGKKFS